MDFDKAYKELKKQITPNEVLAEAYFGLGRDLANERKYEDAVKFFSEAVKYGHKSAINDLGVVYERIRDIKNAIFYYYMGTLENIRISYSNLGNILKSIAKSDNEYKRAIAQFIKGINKYDCPSCYYMLGKMYEEGLGVERDLNKAFEIWHEGYLKNPNTDTQCCFQIGYAYEYGRGVEINRKLSLEYYEKSANNGDEQAMYNAAIQYRNGYGCKVNQLKCVELLEQSASKGYSPAMLLLGILFQDGGLFPKDSIIAKNWYRKAMMNDEMKAFLYCIETILDDDDENKEESVTLILTRFHELKEKVSEEVLYYYHQMKQNPRYREFLNMVEEKIKDEVELIDDKYN